MRTLLTLFIVMGCTNAWGQIDRYIQALEPSIMECEYDCTEQTDTLGTDVTTERVILRIGKTISQCYGYPMFYCDSLFYDPTGRKIWGEMMIGNIRKRNYASLPIPRILHDYIYKNYPKGKMTSQVMLGTTNGIVNCYIEEEYAPQDWVLRDSIRTIQGYACQLATCHYHGRDYEAWFTPEIAVSEGPWKFNGLPGLILEVYDTKKHYQFKLVGLRKEAPDVCLFKFRDHGEKIDRIKYLRMEEKAENRGITVKQKGSERTIRKNAQGQIIAHDFMETDYH